MHVPGRDNELTDAISRDNLAMPSICTGPAGGRAEGGGTSGTIVNTCGHPARLDLDGLVPTLQYLFSAGLDR